MNFSPRMKELNAPDRVFWEKVKSVPTKILALDYDGTLAPFQVERMAARPLPGVSAALSSILD